MSLQSLITKWGSSYTVTRRVSGDYVNGVYTDGASSTFSITASIQPVAGDDLKTLPEGQHAEDTRILFTETELRVRKTGNEPDQISVDGLNWEVINVEKWSAPSFGTHYKCLIAKTTVTPP